MKFNQLVNLYFLVLTLFIFVTGRKLLWLPHQLQKIWNFSGSVFCLWLYIVWYQFWLWLLSYTLLWHISTVTAVLVDWTVFTISTVTRVGGWYSGYIVCIYNAVILFFEVILLQHTEECLYTLHWTMGLAGKQCK